MAQQAFKFEIKGIKELLDAFDQLPTMSMKKNVIRKALKKAAEPVKELAQTNARGGVLIDNPEVLANSIKVTSNLKRSQRSGFDKSRVTMYVGSSSPLAHLFEFGTAERYKKSGSATGYIPAMPFMRPAWDSKKRVALKIFKEEMWIAIQKAARLLAKKAAKGTLTAKQIAGLRR
jgi:HK97 gp10 family phage protein